VTMRLLCLVVVCAMVGVVAALPITDTTTLSQEGLSVTILHDAGVRSAELITGGVRLDNDTLLTAVQGGVVTIIVEKWGGEYALTLTSSVPQTITHRWVVNGSVQYIKVGSELFRESLPLTTEPTSVTLVPTTTAVRPTTTPPSVVTKKPTALFIVRIGTEFFRITIVGVVVVVMGCLGVVGVVRWLS